MYCVPTESCDLILLLHVLFPFLLSPPPRPDNLPLSLVVTKRWNNVLRPLRAQQTWAVGQNLAGSPLGQEADEGTCVWVQSGEQRGEHHLTQGHFPCPLTSVEIMCTDTDVVVARHIRELLREMLIYGQLLKTKCQIYHHMQCEWEWLCFYMQKHKCYIVIFLRKYLISHEIMSYNTNWNHYDVIDCQRNSHLVQINHSRFLQIFPKVHFVFPRWKWLYEHQGICCWGW